MKCAYIEKKSFMDRITLTKCKQNHNLCRISLVVTPLNNGDSSLMGCDTASFCKSFLKFQRTVVPSSSGTSSPLGPWRSKHYYPLKHWDPFSNITVGTLYDLCYHLWRHFRKYSLCITSVMYRSGERISLRGHWRLEVIVQTGPDQ